MIRGWPILLLLSVLPVAQAAVLELDSGERQVTLIELYTSQGCSSCPPAERWLNSLRDRETLWSELVPLALHVDYWDYIGWRDPFARPQYGERQRAYARARRVGTVYTPGFVVNGREWRSWMRGQTPRQSERMPGSLRAVIDDSMIRAGFPPQDGALDLHVALLGAGIETDVTRGENRGRTLRQEFVVLEHDVYRAADGRWAVPRPVIPGGAGRYAIVLWVNRAGDQEPLQATGGWLEDAAPLAVPGGMD